ncbi:MAG: methyl-accepting chemotaxis protein [Pararhodobacter sp.]
MLVAEVSSELDQVSARIEREGKAIADLHDGAEALSQVNDEVNEAARQAGETGELERKRIATGLNDVSRVMAGVGGLADSAESVGEQVSQLNTALELVSRAAAEISAIARMTNLLAVNATIEASRSGEAGRGFKIIAQEVKSLSQRTTETTEQIGRTLDQLNTQTAGVTEAADTMLERMRRLRDDGSGVSQTLSVISGAMDSVIEQQQRICEAIAANSATIAGMQDGIAMLDEGATRTKQVVSTVEGQVEKLFASSQNLMGACVSLDVETDDSPFVRAVQQAAAEIAARFEQELDSGQIGESDLFDRNYQPIPGTDPQQLMTRCVPITDRLLPPVQEPALKLSDKVVFCAAVDANGFLPTHNLKFSQPQRPAESDWNTANCRNRRIFADRTGLAAARNRAPFLLQVYRRDMGGGVFALMKDVSAPIFVRGKHWGGLRLAYRA